MTRVRLERLSYYKSIMPGATALAQPVLVGKYRIASERIVCLETIYQIHLHRATSMGTDHQRLFDVGRFGWSRNETAKHPRP